MGKFGLYELVVVFEVLDPVAIPVLWEVSVELDPSGIVGELELPPPPPPQEAKTKINIIGIIDFILSKTSHPLTILHHHEEVL